MKSWQRLTIITGSTALLMAGLIMDKRPRPLTIVDHPPPTITIIEVQARPLFQPPP